MSPAAWADVGLMADNNVAPARPPNRSFFLFKKFGLLALPILTFSPMPPSFSPNSVTAPLLPFFSIPLVANTLACSA